MQKKLHKKTGTLFRFSTSRSERVKKTIKRNNYLEVFTYPLAIV